MPSKFQVTSKKPSGSSFELSKDEDPKKATMKFNVQLLEYNGDDSWVDDTIKEISKCLKSSECPEHSMTGFGPKGDQPCEYKVFLDGVNNI